MTDCVDSLTGMLKIPYGEEKRALWGRNADGTPDGKQCHDCGVKFGQYHLPGCDVEECPRCGYQAISCRCNEELGDNK